MNTLISNPLLELITMKMLYMAVKNPYNTISEDADYIYAMKRLLYLCEVAGIDLNGIFTADDNLIFADILNLIKAIKEDTNENTPTN